MTEVKMTRAFAIALFWAALGLFGLWGCAEPKLETVEVTPDTVALSVGENTTFKARALSGKGEEMPGVTLRWSLEGDAGSVDQAGVFTAQKPGESMVLAAADGITGKARVTVHPAVVAQFDMEPHETAALPGSTLTFRFTALTVAHGPAAYSEVILSSSPEGSSVSPKTLTLGPSGEGQFTLMLAPQPGPHIITLRSGEAVKELRVEATKVTRIDILPREDQFEAGQEVVFTAVGFDSFGNQAPIAAQWSLSGENAVIREGSTVLMQRPGRGILLATYEEVRQGHPFMVVAGKVARLEIEPSSIELQAGQSADFTAKGFNAHGLPVPAKVQWSVEGEVGTIAQDGTFLARTAGKGAVRASSDSVVAEVPVTVQHGPLADIEVQLTEKRLTAGETVPLSAQGVDAYGNRFPISAQWSLSRSIGTVQQQESTFTPLHAGTGEIRASVGNILRSVPVEVMAAELARLQIVPQALDMIAGEEVQFEVQGFDRFGNSVAVEPEFSIDEPLGDLSASGHFRGTRAGSTVVRARVKDLSVESTLAVSPAEVVRVVIEPVGPVDLTAGKTQEFKAHGSDSFGNIVESSIRWSVYPDLGLMDDQGIFFPKRAGKGEVIAALTQIRTGRTLEAKTAVGVAPGETTRIDIQPPEIQVTAGREVMFSAVTYDQFGNETAVPLSWSLSEPTLGSVSDNGLFTAVKAGGGKVVARYENVSGEGNLRVVPAEVAFLKIIPEEFSLKAGETIELKVLGEDSFGNVVDAEVLWSLSDPSLGNISAEGTLTAQKEGKGYVVATARHIVDLAPLEVKAGPLYSIEVRPSELAVSSGETVTFEATGFDAAGNPLPITPQWSVDEQLGALQQNGLFSARKAGSGEVSASVEGIRGTARILILPGPPASIEVEPREIATTAGNREEIVFKVFDANGNLITDPQIRWELDKGLGTMVEPNRFHAQRTGQDLLRLTAGNVTVQVPVTIQVGKVRLIEIEPAEVNLTAGEKMVFSAKALDGEGNEVPLEAAWTVAGGVGSIAEGGVFEALKAGEGYVALSMDGVMGVASITVQPGPMARIEVTPESAHVRAGETLEFTARALDAQGNVTSAEFTWSMEPEGSGRAVSPAGVFEVLKAGESRVIAKADSVQGEAKIRIEPGPLAEITASHENIRLTAGDSLEISVVGKDAFGNTLAVSPKFEAAPPALGTLTEAGVFTAHKRGEGRLTVAANGIQVRIPVEVMSGEIHTLALQLPSEDIVAGKKYQLKVTAYDKGGNEVPAEVSWAATEGIGKIELDTGVFHAIKAGTGMVVVYGHGLTVQKPLEVKPGELHRFFIEPNPVDVESNTTQTFEVKGFDVEQNAVPLVASAMTWDQVGGIGVFEQPGTLRATRVGKGKVTATLGGLQAEAYVTVVSGKPDPGNSRIRVIYPVLASDGEAFSEIIVEVRDFYNNPVPNAQATLVSTRQADILVHPPKTDPQGLARGRISSTQPGTSVVSAVIQGQTIRDTARVTFE